MESMGNPYRALPASSPRDVIRGVASNVGSLRVHYRAAVHRAELTRALAEGADPRATSDLSLRAQQLTSERSRRTFARSLRRAIAEARQPARTRAVVPIIDRRAVLDAEADIKDTIQRLLASQPVGAKGMAMIERILTNADRSPLYNRSEPGTLGQTIRLATAELAAQPAQSHEFSLAA
jgi:hypothetical protein